jgi:hypothetical protein
VRERNRPGKAGRSERPSNDADACSPRARSTLAALGRRNPSSVSPLIRDAPAGIRGARLPRGERSARTSSIRGRGSWVMWRRTARRVGERAKGSGLENREDPPGRARHIAQVVARQYSARRGPDPTGVGTRPALGTGVGQCCSRPVRGVTAPRPQDKLRWNGRPVEQVGEHQAGQFTRPTPVLPQGVGSAQEAPDPPAGAFLLCSPCAPAREWVPCVRERPGPRPREPHGRLR